MSEESENFPTQVYVVTSGSYSDYGIMSVWLTLEEAEAAGGDRVEVYPIGNHERTLGNFNRFAQVDHTTGKVTEQQPFEGPDISEDRVVVCCWPDHIGAYANQLGIRVTASTQERADKVFSEVRARVLADISLGLPMEAIADQKYDPSARNKWVSTGDS